MKVCPKWKIDDSIQGIPHFVCFMSQKMEAFVSLNPEYGFRRTYLSIISGVILLCCSSLVLSLSSCASAPVVDASLARTELDQAWDLLWNNETAKAHEIFGRYESVPAFTAECARGQAWMARLVHDYPAYLEAVAVAVAADPGSAANAVFLQDLTRESGIYDQKQDISKLSLLYRKALDGKRPAWLRNLAWRGFIEQYREGLAKVAPATLPGFNVAASWNILGPFSRLEVDRKLPFSPALLLPGNLQGLSYVNDKGNTLRWGLARRTNFDGSMTPLNYLGGANDVSYAHASISVPKTGDYHIVMDRSCGTRVWVNGELAIDDIMYRDGVDMHWQRIALKAGEQQVVVEVRSRDGEGSFRVALVNADRPASYDEAMIPAMTGIPALPRYFLQDPLLGRLASGLDSANDIENSLLLSRLLQHRGLDEAAILVLDRIPAAIRESSAVVIGYEFDAWYGVPLAARGAAVARRAMAGTLVPQGIIEAMALESVFTGRYVEARQYINDLNEDSLYTRRLKRAYEVFCKLGEKGIEAYKDYADYAAEFPGDQTLNELVWHFKRSELLYGPFLRSLDATRFRWRSLDDLYAWLDEEDVDWAAAAVRARLAALEPSHPIIGVQRFFAPMKGNTLDVLAARINASLEEYPDNPAILAAAMGICGRLYGERELRMAAGVQGADSMFSGLVALYETLAPRYLRLFPDSPLVRKHFYTITGKPNFDNFITWESADDIIAAYRKSGYQTDADTVVIFEAYDYVLYPDGGAECYIDDILELRSQAGLARYGTIYLSGSRPEIKAIYAIRPDGSLLYPQRRGSSVVFPGLAVGDIIVQRYKSDSTAFVSTDKGGFAVKDYWRSESDFIAKRTRFIYPERFTKVFTRVHNDPNSLIKQELGNFAAGFKAVTYTSEAMPSVGPRASGVDAHDLQIWVELATSDDWQNVSDWYEALADYRSLPEPAINLISRELAPANASREEYIRAAFDYVSAGFRYEDLRFMYSAAVPQWPSTVVRDGYGDCKDKATLLRALLAARDIDSFFVLHNTEATETEAAYPNPSFFNHVFVGLPGGLDGKSGELLIDPTLEVFTLSSLPAIYANTRYLPIVPREARDKSLLEGPMRVELGQEESAEVSAEGTGPATADGMEEAADKEVAQAVAVMGVPAVLRELPRVRVSPKGGTECTVEIVADRDSVALSGAYVMRGSFAGVLREISKLSSQRFRNDALRKVLSGAYPGIAIDKADLHFVDTLAGAPVLQFDGSANGLLARTGAGGRAKLALPRGMAIPDWWANFASADTGNNFFDITAQMAIEPFTSTVIVRKKSGYISSTPSNAYFSFKGARVLFEYRQNGDALECRYSIAVPPMRVEQADWPEFARFVADVSAKQRETLDL